MFNRSHCSSTLFNFLKLRYSIVLFLFWLGSFKYLRQINIGRWSASQILGTTISAISAITWMGGLDMVKTRIAD